MPLDTSVATERTNCNIPAANSFADQEHTKTTQKTKAAVTASKRHPGPGRVSSRVAAVREIKKKKWAVTESSRSPYVVMFYPYKWLQVK